MFEFRDITLSTNRSTLTARCPVDPGCPCFSGHFPDRPLLPAVIQLQMLETLMAAGTDWNVKINAGTALKFLQPVLPGELLDLRLEREDASKIRFSLSSGGSLKSKGQLYVSGANHA